MAVLTTCSHCGKGMMVSHGCYGTCDDCNGVNEQHRQQEQRWQGLTTEQKLESLRQEIDGLRQQMKIRDARF